MFLASRSSAQPTNPAAGAQLRPGVIVDVAKGRAFVMTPEGGIDAVGLANGNTLWSTKEAAKPLGLAGDHLVSQAEPAPGADALQIVALNSADGAPVLRAQKPLGAPGVVPSVARTLNGEFVAAAEPSGGDVRVSWHYRHTAKRGFPEGTVEKIQPRRGRLTPAAAPAAPAPSQGAFLLDLRTGRTTELHAAAAAAPRAAPMARTLAAPDRIAGLAGPQFASADGRSIMTSARTGDDRVWDKYTITIYDRATGNRLGEFKSHVSMAPFVVSDHRLLYVTRAYSRRTDTGVVNEPDKLRAVDLQTGMELWSHPIRDPSPSGPHPS
jgi:hypothetical protein